MATIEAEAAKALLLAKLRSASHCCGFAADIEDEERIRKAIDACRAVLEAATYRSAVTE